MGAEVNILPAAVEACRARGGVVVAQVNAAMPWTYGDGLLSPDDVDYVVEVDEPLLPPHHAEPDDAVAPASASWWPPGSATARPSSSASGWSPTRPCPACPGARGLVVWSEMFSDGVLTLDRAGALDAVAPITASFLLGSPELLRWADRNPRVQLLRTERTNNPTKISSSAR